MKKLIPILIYISLINCSIAQTDSVNTTQENYSFDFLNIRFGAGVFIPNGKLNSYFGVSPLIELNFNVPFVHEKSMDIVLQFAIPNQKQKFEFIRNTDTVLTKSNFMFNVFLKFKKRIFEINKNNLNISFGIGASTITTDARNPYYSGQDGEDKYEFISSILIAPGFDYTHEFKNKFKITLGINYHYSPYKTEGALRDNIGSSGIIPRLLFKF